MNADQSASVKNLYRTYRSSKSSGKDTYYKISPSFNLSFTVRLSLILSVVLNCLYTRALIFTANTAEPFGAEDDT